METESSYETQKSAPKEYVIINDDYDDIND
jgi:hypothetical protein